MRTYYDRGGDKAVVEVARDGLQVVEAFKNSREGELEAILMDIMMPNMDGIEATKTIRSLDRADAKSIPIIAMTANAFVEDMRKTKEAGINVCAHVIFGLWETHDEIMQTAQKLAELRVDGVKIHMLCALEGTQLAQIYREGGIGFMNEDEYVQTVCDFLEYLPKETTIHRLAGNGLSSELIAPKWLGKKFDCLNKIDS